MKIKGWELDYFNSGEWQVCDERLKDLEKISRPVSDGYCPGRANLFAALRSTRMAEVRAVILAQDPYPQRIHATGIAISLPAGMSSDEVPTCKAFLREWSTDLGRPIPSSGDLASWGKRGVLLWNAIPSVGFAGPLSHDWKEYEPLTTEILSKLSAKGGIVFALLGQVARRYLDSIDITNNAVVLTSHPSPRGSLSSKTPFVGSRLFSTINDKLCNMGSTPIDWTLS